MSESRESHDHHERPAAPLGPDELRAALRLETNPPTGEPTAAHPELDELAAYSAAELAPERQAEIEDHLVACRDCAATLLELAPFAAAAAPAEEESNAPADFATAAAWRALRGQLPAPREETAAVAPRRWGGAFAVLAAALLVATVALSLWTARLTTATGELRRQLAQATAPRPDVPLVYLDALTRDEGGGAAEVGALPEDGFFVLVLTPGDPRPGARWNLEIVDPAGQPVWASPEPLTANGYGTVRLGLSRATLPAGRYEVRLTAAGGEGAEEGAAERFELVVGEASAQG
jgi:hypothetical protein